MHKLRSTPTYATPDPIFLASFVFFYTLTLPLGRRIVLHFLVQHTHIAR